MKLALQRAGREHVADGTSNFRFVATLGHHDENHDRGYLKRDLFWLMVSEGSNHHVREDTTEQRSCHYSRQDGSEGWTGELGFKSLVLATFPDLSCFQHWSGDSQPSVTLAPKFQRTSIF